VLGDQVAEHIQTCLARVRGPGGRRFKSCLPDHEKRLLISPNRSIRAGCDSSSGVQFGVQCAVPSSPTEKSAVRGVLQERPRIGTISDPSSRGLGCGPGGRGFQVPSLTLKLPCKLQLFGSSAEP
jgi:hypothetical protein